MDNVETQDYDAETLAATLTGCISIPESDDEGCPNPDKTLDGAGTSRSSFQGETAAPVAKAREENIEDFPSEVRAEVKACLVKAGI